MALANSLSGGLKRMDDMKATFLDVGINGAKCPCLVASVGWFTLHITGHNIAALRAILRGI